ncbi:unnamed protein product [Cuscuta europaea]|uniref:Uncharacterized protein n=1 Tax=Cuscuta europaea TaxID=41803 RepID=A0A9P0Z5Z2_CUSEU|nr:unnamed protein product [Cuscuta europaea]
MSNVNRNRTKEIARNHPSSRKGKGKGRAGSSSQTRNDFETDYHRRDADAMSDEQLQQLLAQQDGRFYQQHDIPEVEDELEDDDAEEDPPTAEGEGDDTRTMRKRSRPRTRLVHPNSVRKMYHQLLTAILKS